MPKIVKSKPRDLSYGPFRTFRVLERQSKFGELCIVLTTGRKGNTKDRRCRTGNYYLMYRRGDFLRLDKMLKWLARAVAYIECTPEIDFKSEFERREKRWHKVYDPTEGEDNEKLHRKMQNKKSLRDAIDSDFVRIW